MSLVQHHWKDVEPLPDFCHLVGNKPLTAFNYKACVSEQESLVVEHVEGC